MSTVVTQIDDRRELDEITGRLTKLCVMLNITPQTLWLAAQHVYNALHGGMNQVEAYLAGVRYAKARQEPSPELERSYREYQNARQQKRLGDALKATPAEVDRAFSDGPQPPRSAA